MPNDLKNQNSKGINSCVATFKNRNLEILIDYNSYIPIEPKQQNEF